MFYKNFLLGDKQNLKSRDSKHGIAVWQKGMIEFVNITLKQGMHQNTFAPQQTSYGIVVLPR